MSFVYWLLTIVWLLYALTVFKLLTNKFKKAIKKEHFESNEIYKDNYWFEQFGKKSILILLIKLFSIFYYETITSLQVHRLRKHNPKRYVQRRIIFLIERYRHAYLFWSTL